MKAQLETIVKDDSRLSFHHFISETPSFEPFWHYHQELELTYIQRGNGLRFVGDHIETFSDGDLVLVGEYLPHNWVSFKKDSDENEIAHVIQFRKGIFSSLPEFEELLPFMDRSAYGISFSNPGSEVIEKILSFQDLKPLKKWMVFTEILAILMEHASSKNLSSVVYPNRSHKDHLQKKAALVTSFILENYDRRITLDELSNLTSMTTQSFCRWFRQSMGVSFIEYLNTIRIEKACQYLMQTDWTILQVSFEVGFESVSNFNRTFKRIKGITPTKFRKEISFQSI